MQRFLVFAGMGVEIGVMVYGAFLIGRELDKTYQTKGLIFAALALIFLAAWLIQIIWLVRLFQKQEEKENPPSPSDPSL
ncbi:MAG: hypothetical protein KF802_09430 [Bdellovibrionaceae bacterium]|nr:hypothetical protein [Pseudobdellovibrionaceae bacterium]MBX3033662.1 hypothetical protein [Pseudobdellovibrionaceae bacterium]